MYSIDIDKDIIIGIEEVSVDSLVPHEKVLIDKKEILKSSLKSSKRSKRSSNKSNSRSKQSK